MNINQKVILIFLALLFIYIPLRMFGVFWSHTGWTPPKNAPPDYIIAELFNYMNPEGYPWAVGELIKRGKEPQIHQAVLANDERYGHPVLYEFILFRIGDMREKRIKRLTDALAGSNASYVLSLFSDHLGPDAHYFSSQVPLMISLVSSSDEETKKYAVRALACFTQEPGVAEAYVGILQGQDLQARDVLLETLERAFDKNPSLTHSQVLRSALLSLAADNTDHNSQFYACRALGRYAKDQEVNSTLVRVLTSGTSVEVRNEALESLNEVGPVGYAFSFAWRSMLAPGNEQLYAGATVFWNYVLLAFVFLTVIALLIYGVMRYRSIRFST